MIQNKRPSEKFIFRRPFIKTDQFGLGHFHTQMAASIVQIKKMILDKPCQTPNVPPTRDSSQLSRPYLCASITGVTKRWLQAKSNQRTNIHQESEASCRLKKAQAAPKITKPHIAVIANKMPAISPACILGRRRNRIGAVTQPAVSCIPSHMAAAVWIILYSRFIIFLLGRFHFFYYGVFRYNKRPSENVFRRLFLFFVGCGFEKYPVKIEIQHFPLITPHLML